MRTTDSLNIKMDYYDTQRTLDAWLRGRRGQKRKREYYRLKF